ncbi:deoxycytidylate deaminase [Gigaspora rosea]|uniref:Deoxycytidylate deaminase n=1 Tax=Gigaspora rosea TaxID=44941 RepID=A0A397W2U5_9GLOM|nr:deoxycytidylate deaminase [Gigaspora rosea]
MFIGITGSICSGKHTIAEWLVSVHGFTPLTLRDNDNYRLDALHFETPSDLLEYVTKNWIDNFVTCDIDSLYVLETYRKRPFFLLLAVDGPLTIRYQRCLARCQDLGHQPPTLERFIIENDERLFKIGHTDDFSISSIYNLMTMADLNIVNSFLSLQLLYAHLHGLNITNSERLRPSWDTYFMHLSDLAALRSNCMKRRVGCILVKDFRVIATGYNGTARGLKNCNQGGCERCNDAVSCGKELDTCLCLHAEENALLEAGRERIGQGSILYCNTCPCLRCSVKLIQSGVTEVVYNKTYGMDSWTSRILKEAGIKLRQHSPPTMRLVLQKSDYMSGIANISDIMM